ncbi:MAG: acylphosphatase [Bacteroidales bacterium]|nr:acylphosphatase [Bacteroidales bacterium]MCF8388645.1 acylphosphatase [Bacteroidales bacterium]MCF8398068.1 acylphosphatase [Bacteroidales bacterium]
MKSSLIIKVEGRVQGVGFRYYTNQKALELGISGFVKNLGDGSVYIEAEGEKEQMDLFVSWVKEGPEWARVEDVKTQENQNQDYKSFMVR